MKKKHEDKLISQYRKKLKLQKLDEFTTYLIDNKLVDDFINKTLFINLDQDLFKYFIKLSIPDLETKFGKENASKIIGLAMQEPSTSAQKDLIILRNFLSANSQNIDAVNKVLELYGDNKRIVGRHAIGHESGDILNQKGIYLSGHKFLAINNTKTNFDLAKRNVEFVYSSPISGLADIAGNQSYNINQNEKNDIMIVSIPQEIIDNHDDDITITNEQGNKALNPKYIAGYLKIDVKNHIIENFTDNPLYEKSKEIEQKEQNNKNILIYDWQSEIETWYEEVRKPKLSKIKNKLLERLSKIKQIFYKKDIKYLSEPKLEQKEQKDIKSSWDLSNWNINKEDFIQKSQADNKISEKTIKNDELEI